MLFAEKSWTILFKKPGFWFYFLSKCFFWFVFGFDLKIPVMKRHRKQYRNFKLPSLDSIPLQW